MKVYLDNAATTKLDNEVFEAMLPYMKEEFGTSLPYTHTGAKPVRLLRMRVRWWLNF